MAGDHIHGDVASAAVECEWAAVAVVEELEPWEPANGPEEHPARSLGESPASGPGADVIAQMSGEAGLSAASGLITHTYEGRVVLRDPWGCFFCCEEGPHRCTAAGVLVGDPYATYFAALLRNRAAAMVGDVEAGVELIFTPP